MWGYSLLPSSPSCGCRYYAIPIPIPISNDCQSLPAARAFRSARSRYPQICIRSGIRCFKKTADRMSVLLELAAFSRHGTVSTQNQTELNEPQYFQLSAIFNVCVRVRLKHTHTHTYTRFSHFTYFFPQKNCPSFSAFVRV